MRKLFPLKLAICAITMFIVVAWHQALWSKGGHDPLWWQAAGISDTRRRRSLSHDTTDHDHANVVTDAIRNMVKNHAVVGGRELVGHAPDVTQPVHDNNNVAQPLASNNVPETTQATTQQQQQATLAQPPKYNRKYTPLVQNVDFFADYDVNSISIPPNEHYETPTANASFQYVDAFYSPFEVTVLSYSPRILFVRDFMSHEECDALVAEAEKSMARSQVAVVLGSKGSTVQDVRTSSQTWLSRFSSKVTNTILNRVVALTGFPMNRLESAMQVLRYQFNQKYDAHNDYFDPKYYGKQRDNRAATFFMYLSDVEEGGETQFPRANHGAPTFDFTSCSKGLRVRPKKGSAVLFYDMKPNGEFDPHSLHGGCPVKKGVKYAATQWLRIPTPWDA